MAEPSTTSGAKPLSEAEERQRSELNQRAADAAYDQAETDRQTKLASFASVDALVKLANTDKVRAAIDTVLNDPMIDFDTKQQVTAFKSSLDYNLGQLATKLTALSTPTSRNMS